MNKRLFLSFLLICVYYYLGAQGATGPLASMFSEEEERAFGDAFVVKLNELIKQQ
jgi:hypothetical protein